MAGGTHLCVSAVPQKRRLGVEGWGEASYMLGIMLVSAAAGADVWLACRLLGNRVPGDPAAAQTNGRDPSTKVVTGPPGCLMSVLMSVLMNLDGRGAGL